MIDNVVTLGEGLAIFRSGPDAPLWSSDQVTVATGGAEANVAMAVARLGVPVTWLGRVGDDSLGRRILRELRAEGVTVRGIIDGTAPTGALVKEQHPGGRTTVTYYRAGSAGSLLSIADLDQLELGEHTLLHVTGITPALSSVARRSMEALLERAARERTVVSFDVNHRGRLWSAEQASSVYGDMAHRADIVFASVDEVSFLAPGWTGDDPQSGAEALAAAGLQHVIVTAGAQGAVARIGDELFRVTAVPVEVVDSVGAGDAFVGGYLVGLLRGNDPLSRLQLGTLLGAAACRHPGDWEGVADLSGLDGTASGDPVVR